MNKLVPRAGDNRIFELKEGVNILGRGESTNLRIDDTSASAAHCEIKVLGDSIIVTDLGSTNGTFINGNRITKRVLRRGDILKIGSLEMVLDTSSEEQATPSKPASNDRLETNSKEVMAPGSARISFLVKPWFHRSAQHTPAIIICILVPLLLTAMHLLASTKHYAPQGVIDELGAIKKFFGNPGPNHAGTKVFYMQTVDKGVGMFLCDVANRSSLLLNAVDQTNFNTKECKD